MKTAPRFKFILTVAIYKSGRQIIAEVKNLIIDVIQKLSKLKKGTTHRRDKGNLQFMEGR